MSKKVAEVCFILVHYHAPEITLRAVESIDKHKSKLTKEVIIVDNGSSIQERELILRQLQKIKIKVILSERQLNPGYAGAINFAFKRIKSKYIAIVNNDAELLAGWLDALSTQLQSDDEIGMVGGIEIDDSGSTHLPPRLVLKNLTTILRESCASIESVEFLSGSNILLKRADFIPWCASYFLYYEDIAACLNIWKSKKRVELVTNAKIHHQQNTTTSSIPIKKGVYATRNRYRLGYQFLSRSELTTLWVQGLKGDLIGSVLRIIYVPIKIFERIFGVKNNIRSYIFETAGRLIGFLNAVWLIPEFIGERRKMYDANWSLAKLLMDLDG